jgi:hypothetical protein
MEISKMRDTIKNEVINKFIKETMRIETLRSFTHKGL